jgi:hypothetical protein
MKFASLLLLSLLSCTTYYAGVKAPAEGAKLLQIAYRKPPLLIPTVNGVSYGFFLNPFFFAQPGRNDLEVIYSISDGRTSIGSKGALPVRVEGAGGTSIVVCDQTAPDMSSFSVHFYSVPFHLTDDHEGKRLLDAACEVFDWVTAGRNLDVARALKWGLPLSMRSHRGATLADHIRKEAQDKKNPDLLKLIEK